MAAEISASDERLRQMFKLGNRFIFGWDWATGATGQRPAR